MRAKLAARFSRTEWLYLTTVALLAVTLIAAASSRYGLGVSTDGLHYLAAADNLAKGEGLIDYKGALLDSWAPALPSLMAGVHLLTGLSTLNSAALINMASVVASIFLLAVMLKELQLSSPMWLLAGTLSYAIFASAIALAANVATEPLFAFVVLLFLFQGQRYDEKRSPRELILLALVAAIAPLIRWVGVTLIFAGVIFLFVIHAKDIRTWIRQSLIFGTSASLPFVAWVWGRNYRLVGNFVGPRQTQYDYIEPLGNLQLFYARIAQWFVPNSLSKRVDFWIIVLLVLATSLMISKRAGIQQWWAKLSQGPNLVVLIFSLFYFAFMVFVVATREHRELYDDRYLVPIYLPILLLLFDYLDQTIAFRFPWKTKVSTVLLGAGLSLWLAFQGFQSMRLIQVARLEGVPYYNHFNAKPYHESGLLQGIDRVDFDPALTIYSNDSAAVYFFTGRMAKNSLSDANYVARDEGVLSEAEGWPHEGRAYLIWLLPNWKQHYFSPEQLSQVAQLELILEDADGEIYLVDRLH